MLDFNTQSQISSEISNIQDILDSKVLENSNKNLKANWTSLLISLKDLMIKSDKILSKRINFTESVKITPKVHDVTDLISFARNAACHPEADNLKGFQKDDIYINASFNYIFGIFTPVSIKGEAVIKNEDPDDSGLNIGEHVVYLNKHVKRAFAELKKNFDPYL